MTIPAILRPLRIAFLIGLAVYILGVVLWQFGVFQEPELYFYDHCVRWASNPAATDPRIVLVELTEKDIDHLDYPLHDSVLSEVLEKIETGGANVIGVDFYRDLPEPRDHSEIAILNKTLLNHPNIVSIFLYDPATRKYSIPPPPAVADNPSRFALNNFPDLKVVRRAFLLCPWGKEFTEGPYPSLSLLMVEFYFGSHNIAMSMEGDSLKLGQTVIPRLRPSDGGYVNDLTGGYSFLQDFRGPTGPSSFVTLSVTAIRALKDPSIFRDKLVLVGIAADSSNDTFTTPVSRTLLASSGKLHETNQILADDKGERVPGVMIHAQILNQLLRIAIDGDKPTSSFPPLFGWLWIAAWCLAGVLIGFHTRSYLWFTLAFVLSLGGIVLTGWILFLHGYWILVAAPASAFALTAVLAKSYAASYEQQQRQNLMRLFSQRLTAAVADEIWNQRDTFLEGGRPAARRLTVTALFTDLKNYSTISEKMSPGELIAWVNECQAALSGHVEKNKGMVKCFMGDGMMALFGAPRPRETEAEFAADARSAVTSALGMAAEIKRMNDRWRAEGRPIAGLRVGIYTGPAVAGDLGSGEYLEYSVIGDTINTASRLESVDKEGTLTAPNEECRILIGELTHHYLGNRHPTLYVTSIKLKGQDRMTKVYKVLDSPSGPEHNKLSP